MSMFVIKRDGQKEEVSFDKVLKRIKGSSDKLVVNPTIIAQKVLSGLKDGIHTQELDELATRTAISLTTTHPDYGVLAARIAVSNHQKNTNPSFSAVVGDLANQKQPVSGEPYSCFNDEFVAAVSAHGPKYDAIIDHERDFLLDYFGFKTLERAYLLKGADGRIRERPQHLWMRVAVALWGGDIDKVRETYDALSTKKFIHATPTLFNAGTIRQQLSSCYLLSMDSDSIGGIFKTLSDCAMISKYAGGIGLHIHNIRAKGTIIRGTNGVSNGIVPMLRVFNNTARYVDQGGGKRNGSFAIYLEPWHADIEDFLKLKLNQGAEEERARDLFYALWVPDLFMKRVEAGEDWTLFCPAEAPGLADVWGAEFEELYLRYEKEGRGKKKVAAQKLWFKVLEAQIETGTPYLLYKDAANAKSNQQNLGTIKSSNLCVAPDTLILTREGEVEIQSVAGKEVEVWNGVKWSKTIVQKTGEKQPLLKVEVLVGKIINENKGEFDFELKEISCTPYHKFIVEDDDDIAQSYHSVSSHRIANNRRVDARDLKRGMCLVQWMDKDGRPVSSIVWSVTEYEGHCDDTYCFNEPELHAGVFNGVLTGNCTEIIEYSSQDETAVCNLASISLPSFIKQTGAKREFDYEELRRVTKMITRNLNKVIDINFYPTPETLKSNMRHRPIGIGVQGLADAFAMMRYSWESEKALELNRRIFANIYYAAVEASAEMAGESGAYETFAGSPASHGKLQFDLWDVDPKYADPALDWDGLREKAKRGLRNSLLVAPMPTASTSQILGNTEAFEPATSNIFTRRTLAGEFIIVNKYLLNDLMRYDVWNDQMKQRIIANNGSVQGIAEIPKALQELYKTAWEIKQKTLLDMAAERGAFICQSQSLNLFVADPTFAKLTSMHFYGWKRGLKTGQYYLRSKAPVVAQKFTVDPELQRAVEESLQKQNEPQEGCLMCSG